MHITAMLKLGSTLIKLLLSSKYLYHILIKCKKDMIKG